MPQNVALADLLTPYVLRGQNLGGNHAVLSAIRVAEFETFADDSGVAIRGRCEFPANILFNPFAGQFQVTLNEADPPRNPGQNAPIFDLRETSVDFELVVPRVSGAVATNAALGVAAVQPIVAALGPTATRPGDDRPATDFTLDLILNAPAIRPPFLHPAALTDGGLLVPVSGTVAITLPRLRFRLTHGGPAGPQLRFELVAVGTTGLDDPADIRIARFATMTPPYAFIGDLSDRTVGIGFDSAELDLSEASTPADVLESFGFGDDWKGLHVPLLRLFVAPEGARDFAFEAGVTHLLIGFGDSAGVSGDFEAAVIQQGSGLPVVLNARFIGPGGQPVAVTSTGPGTATVDLPADTYTLVVDASGGRPPYGIDAAVDQATFTNQRTIPVDLTKPPATGPLIKLKVTDSTGVAADPNAQSPEATLEIAVRVVPKPASLPVPRTPPATPKDATLAMEPGGSGPPLVIADQTGADVQVTAVPPAAGMVWQVDPPSPGAVPPPGAGATIKVAKGQTVTVTATLPAVTGATEEALDFFFRYNQPPGVAQPTVEESTLGGFARAPGNLGTRPARSEDASADREAGNADPWAAHAAKLDAVGPNATIWVVGEASNEGDPTREPNNFQLARRRAVAVRRAMLGRYAAANRQDVTIHIDPPEDDPGTLSFGERWPGHTDPARRMWWKATARLPAGLSVPQRVSTAKITRPAATTPTPTPAPVTPQQAAPSWFVGARLVARIARDKLVALEVDLDVNIAAALDEKLPGDSALTLYKPKDHNTKDGLTKLRLLAQADEPTGRTVVSIAIGADAADKDGLLLAGRPIGAKPSPTYHSDEALQLLGKLVAFWPAITATGNASDGDVAAVATTGVFVAIDLFEGAGWLKVERVILFGGEYLQRTQDGEIAAFLLFDVEADLSVDVQIFGQRLIEIPPETPLAVRYKSAGLRLGSLDEAKPFELRPVFDTSRGYSVEVPKGSAIKVAPPFDKILRVLAARVSRTNPMALEVDLGMAADLGVVSVERARVRAWLDSDRLPELTALAASVDIKGVLAGSGFIEFGGGGFAGAIDMLLVPIRLRVSGAISMQPVEADGRKATALFVSIDVTLPAAIPLAASGLGIFGFRGLFGMHFARSVIPDTTGQPPALLWLKASGGKPNALTAPDGQPLWETRLDNWAFGLGVLLGSMDGGTLISLDGTLLIELPGPRLLIMMNARVLQGPPAGGLNGIGKDNPGSVLAVLELAPDRISISLLIEKSIEPLLRISVPVDALFSIPASDEWYVRLGTRTAPVQVKILGIVDGTGYLQLEGTGLPALNDLPEVKGFAVGVGAGASFLWGSKKARLYLTVGGSIDAVMGFDPFLMSGSFVGGGELRLFIVSIGASLRLTVTTRETEAGGLKTRIDGEVRGSVKLLFYELEGSVEIRLGDPADPLEPPKLVDKLMLKNRSPALAEGSAAGSPLDGVLGEAEDSPAMPATMKVVPIDVVPMLAMTAPPAADGVSFFDEPLAGPTGLPAAEGTDPRRYASKGSEKYAYVLQSVTLERVGQPGSPVIGTDTPATWCLQSDPDSQGAGIVLALLSYEPTVASKAIALTADSVQTLKDRWTNLCGTPAPAASVLYHFNLTPPGASVKGWTLNGMAWPDPPGSFRSAKPDTTLRISEPWRNRPDAAKALVVPALVLPGKADCYEKPVPPRRPWPGPIGPYRPVPPILRGASAASALSAAAIAPSVLGTAALAGSAADRIANLAAGRIAIPDIRQPPPPPPPPGPAVPIGTTVPPRKLCDIRLLESPLFDDGRIFAPGTPANTAQSDIAALIAQLSGKPAPGPALSFGLKDRVLIECEAVERLVILLFVSTTLMRNEAMVLRRLDAAGAEIARTPLGFAQHITTAAQLPPRWRDPAGPWAETAVELFQWTGVGEHYMPLLVTVEPHPQLRRVEIGSNINTPGGALAPYFVAAIERLTTAEVKREQVDAQQIAAANAVIDQVFNPKTDPVIITGTSETVAKPSSAALLFPGSTYRLTVASTVHRQSDDPDLTYSHTQHFWFQTEALPPVRLDPWVLTTSPADGEAHVFAREPIRIVFNTCDVDRLYGAYGRTLEVRLQASSSHHPGEGGLTPMQLEALAEAAILSPFEEALEIAVKEAGKTCIAVKDRVRHAMASIDLPLDPYTDYILDVVASPGWLTPEEQAERAQHGSSTAPPAERSVYRRHFSTGGYDDLGVFARSLVEVLVRHRAVVPGAAQAFAARVDDPQAAAPFDDGLRAAGLDQAGVPDAARITVLWETTGPTPQPTALLIEALEPMWRSRPYPTVLPDPPDLSQPKRTILADKPWLRLEPRPQTDAAVQRIVADPGGARAMVILQPNSRGRTLALDLVRAHQAPWDAAEDRLPVLDLQLQRAPWEEA